MKRLIIYHRDADGFCAALVAWRWAKKVAKDTSSLECVSAQYGESLPKIAYTSDEVYILDFSYPREILEDLAQKTNVVVLDHHKTAQKALEGLPFAQFSSEHSGSMMAYEYFVEKGLPEDPKLKLVCQYVEDRDLWKFNMPFSKAVNAFISTWELGMFEMWEKQISIFDLDKAKFAGRAILLSNGMLINRIGRNVTYHIVEGKNVYVVNSPVFQSELAVFIIAEYDIDVPDVVVIWYVNNNGEYIYSLRGNPNAPVDVAKLAAKLGGGGHTMASGFSSDVPPYANDKMWSVFKESFMRNQQ